MKQYRLWRWQGRPYQLHRVYWWYYPDAGPFEAANTDDIREGGAYGPFESTEEAWASWQVEVGPDVYWASPWTPQMTTAKNQERKSRERVIKEVIAHQSKHRREQQEQLRLMIGLAVIVLMMAVLAFGAARTVKPIDGRSGQYCLVRANGNFDFDQCVTRVPR